MEERRPGLDPGVPGVSSVNGHSPSVGWTRSMPGESHDLRAEPADVCVISGGRSEPPDGISESVGEPGNLADRHGNSLDETDSETTRYLVVVC